MIQRHNFIFICFLVALATQLWGQVTNVRTEHDAANEQYIIRYDLAKEGNQKYFDIELTATIGGVQVRPSLVALSGDVGLNIRYGGNQQIRWDYYVDIEKIIGEVRFKVRARPTYLPPPPQPKLDRVLGVTMSGAGIALTALGGNILSKKGQQDLTASAADDPIQFYYTFCAESSPNRDPSLVQINPNNPVSACDNHLEAANRAYRKGVVQTTIGVALLAGGIYALLKKPFVQKKLKVYRKKYDLTVEPTLYQWDGSTNSVVGLQLRYEFGQ